MYTDICKREYMYIYILLYHRILNVKMQSSPTDFTELKIPVDC